MIIKLQVLAIKIKHAKYVILTAIFNAGLVRAAKRVWFKALLSLSDPITYFAVSAASTAPTGAVDDPIITSRER